MQQTEVWEDGHIIRRWPQWGPFCSLAYRVACVSDVKQATSDTADEKLVADFLVSVTQLNSQRHTIEQQCRQTHCTTTLRAGRFGTRIPARTRDFLLPKAAQTGSEAHPVVGPSPGNRAGGARCWPPTFLQQHSSPQTDC